MNKPTIVLTGGGTAGHVMPHIAILHHLRNQGWSIYYIGSRHGIEKEILKQYDILYKGIYTGKLRRYFSWQNFLDIFKVILGFIQSLIILTKIRPNLVFSKGGFVAVPVCFAAWVLRIPIITHESDYSPGLANRLIGFIANKILFSFDESYKYFPPHKSLYTGNPIREELFEGDKLIGYKLCNFSADDKRPILLVMGGSSGAQRINEVLEKSILNLINDFRIIHITGKNKKTNFSHSNYCAFEFISENLKHILSIVDLVVTRAGANSIFEFLALRKPMLLIPLEIGSRGDQLLNAKYFESKGWAIVLKETQLNAETFTTKILDLKQQAPLIVQTQLTGPSNSMVIQHILTTLISHIRDEA